MLSDSASHSVVSSFLQTPMHTISLFSVQLLITSVCKKPRPLELKLHSLLPCPVLSILAREVDYGQTHSLAHKKDVTYSLYSRVSQIGYKKNQILRL